MIKYPIIDPVAISFGSLQVHWYGIMYIVAFILAWLLLRYRAKKAGSGWTATEIDDLITWGMIGVIVGGRLGYILFYDFVHYSANPLDIIYIWNGGMSFHGGLIGVLLATFLWSRKYKKRYITLLDFISPAVAPGLFFGRIGNFINGELWGKVSSVSWAVVFPHAGSQARHPTQLYEAFLEGLVLFVVLWIYSSKERSAGAVSGLFAILYGVFRFISEFYREPDKQLGYLYSDWFTMGMLLSLPLIVIGGLLFAYSVMKSKNPTHDKVILDDGSTLLVKRKR